MPLIGEEGQRFEDFESCVNAISGNNTTREEAQQICGSFEEVDKEMNEEDKLTMVQKFVKFLSDDNSKNKKSNKEVEKSFEASSEYIQKDEKKQIVYGIVLKSDRPDLENDIFERDVVEKEAHNFMEKVQNFKMSHKFNTDDVSVVESYIAPTDFELNGHEVKKGDWLMATKIHDDKLWKGIEDGNFRGYSVGGTAIKEPAE